MKQRVGGCDTLIGLSLVSWVAGAMVLAAAAAGPAVVAAAVTSADDICAPAADPCVVAQPFDVAPAAVLDFGERAVEFVAGGSLNIGSGTVTLRCGALRTSVAGAVVIDARSSTGGASEGGTLIVEVVGHCSRDPGKRCLRDLGCDLGSCTQGHCKADPSRPCSVPADCDLGSCVADAATLELDGHIRASADTPGTVQITAAGDVTVTGKISAFSTDPDSDGGQIDVESGKGNLTFEGRIDAHGGRLSTGGAVSLNAGRSLTVAGDVVATGGDFGGDTIDLEAGEDLTISGLVDCSATVAAGDGGAIDVMAGRDLLVAATADLRASGHADAEGFAGFGGDITLDAGRYLTVEAGARMEADGARPDGDGGFIDLFADGDLVVAGQLLARSRGAQGGGGEISLDGCGITVANGARLENKGDGGDNLITAHDRLLVEPGSTIVADALTGSNTIEYRRSDRPPVLAGTIEPPADVSLNSELVPCATCGNAVIEGGESCDDGGTAGGDGCSSDCQLETCIAQTPGYPSVPICDDGDGCTRDVCDPATGNCVNIFSCDDEIPCTVDSCDSSGQCVHDPDHAACDDGNPCTQDVCNTSSGCVHAPALGPCDDGISCTSGDSCSGGRCVGTPDCPAGQICSAELDRCIDPSTTTTLPPAVCGNGLVESGEECDDGDTAFTVGDYCTATCRLVGCGDPDGSGLPSASDALFVLRVAVGLDSCHPCVCDVDGSGPPVTASDALRLLRRAVGQPVQIDCVACP